MKVIKLTEDFAGNAAGKVLKMENQVAASLVRRGVATYEEPTEAQPAAEAEPEVKKETTKSKKSKK